MAYLYPTSSLDSQHPKWTLPRSTSFPQLGEIKSARISQNLSEWSRRFPAGIYTNCLLPASPEHLLLATLLKTLGLSAQICGSSEVCAGSGLPSASSHSNTPHSQLPFSSLNLTHHHHQARQRVMQFWKITGDQSLPHYTLSFKKLRISGVRASTLTFSIAQDAVCCYRFTIQCRS